MSHILDSLPLTIVAGATAVCGIMLLAYMIGTAASFLTQLPL